ncbi:MAG: hypothetical protein M0P64_01455 [Candidatus Pacebacteria bacterium]|jgi:hypothetical protein|nr:hypothetical protein [Candidatus Paceibacterota bacterium]
MIDAPSKAVSKTVSTITDGETVPPREVLIRRATSSEQSKHGAHVQHVVDRCPKCSQAIPIVSSKLQNSIFIAVHTENSPQGEIQCSYGGEKLDFQSSLP